MESTLYAVFLLGAVFRAYRAIVARRILSATIYLACISALVSAIVYLMGAAQVAVMELSVGAGLLTVLLVYAVSVVGDDALDPASVIPKPLAFGLVGAVAVILDWMAFPVVQHSFSGISAELVTSLWHSRVLDVWIQRVLFLGVQPASVDIGKRSTRGFCGLWLRLYWDQCSYLPDSSPINIFRLSGNCRETPPDRAAVRFAKQFVPPASSATAGKTISLETGEPIFITTE